MIIVSISCIAAFAAFIALGMIHAVLGAMDKKITNVLFGLTLIIFGVIGELGLAELVDNNNSQYIPAEPLAHNQTQTVFTTDEGTYLAKGLYPDGTYLLTVNGKDVLVVWQAVDGEVG